jgi:hypothetical protein
MSFPPAGLGFQSVGLARAIAGLIRLAEASFIRRAFFVVPQCFFGRWSSSATASDSFVFGREEPGSHRGNQVLRVLHNKRPKWNGQ